METLLSAFRYIFNHVETAVGVSIALILATGILLLIRMLMEKPSTSGGATQLDVQALEGTLKRVLGQAQGVAANATAGEAAPGLGPAGASVAGDPADAARMQALIAEREKMIAELQAALASAKAAASEAPSGSSVDPIAMLELQNKVRDLEARLAEYSIIEDDIADLSMYKDENARLKAELEVLRVQTGTSPAGTVASVGSSEPAVEPATPGVDPVAEFASVVSGHTAPPLKPETHVEAPEPTAESPAASQAAVDAMFASAAAAETNESADGPLMGSLDTSKMLEEVSALQPNSESAEDVLEGALDTDKLLSEVDALKAGAASDPTPNEDLFGEFNDEEKT